MKLESVGVCAIRVNSKNANLMDTIEKGTCELLLAHYDIIVLWFDHAIH